jgi:hypothetical protein
MAGGFNFIHFTKATNGLLIDSQQVTGQAGYDYIINRRNKLAIFYAYQHFHFPQVGGGGFETHVVNLLYGHQISGRWSLTLGAGPQITNFASPAFGKTLRLSASGRASLHYRFPKTGLSLSYEHLTSAGGGFFAGSTTDLVQTVASRPISRRWDLSGSLGYQRSKRLQSITLGLRPDRIKEDTLVPVLPTYLRVIRMGFLVINLPILYSTLRFVPLLELAAGLANCT